MAHSASTAESTLPPLVSGPYRKRIGLISIIACFGGLLFGYDTGVSNGAERPMQAELGLSDLQVGVVISSLIFAAAVGALIGGQISHAWGGREKDLPPPGLVFTRTPVVGFFPGLRSPVAR